MNAHHTIEGETIEIADSWGTSVTESLERSRRTAWIVASVATAIALLLAIALVVLIPLRTVVPYTLLVMSRNWPRSMKRWSAPTPRSPARFWRNM